MNAAELEHRATRSAGAGRAPATSARPGRDTAGEHVVFGSSLLWRTIFFGSFTARIDLARS